MCLDCYRVLGARVLYGMPRLHCICEQAMCQQFNIMSNKPRPQHQAQALTNDTQLHEPHQWNPTGTAMNQAKLRRQNYGGESSRCGGDCESLLVAR